MMNFSNENYSLILPARIVEYYPANQTADVLICVERIYQSAEVNNKLESRTPIEGVPVHTPSGGGWSVTFPVKPGDTCLMLFSQVGYDHWLYDDADEAGAEFGMPMPHVLRRFKEDDGFCFVGINTLPKAITDYHETSAQFRGPVAANQVISLNDDASINIDSSVSVTINAPEVVINCDTADINATSLVTIDSPETVITGDLNVNGAVTNDSTVTTTGAVINLATVGTTGLTTTGGLAVAGGAAADLGSGATTSTGSISANGVDLELHVHAGDGGTGSSANTGPPL